MSKLWGDDCFVHNELPIDVLKASGEQRFYILFVKGSLFDGKWRCWGVYHKHEDALIQAERERKHEWDGIYNEVRIYCIKIPIVTVTPGKTEDGA